MTRRELREFGAGSLELEIVTVDDTPRAREVAEELRHQFVVEPLRTELRLGLERSLDAHFRGLPAPFVARGAR